MNSFDENLSTLDGGKILDVATGFGDLLEHLADNFKSYESGTGIDIAVEKITETIKNNKKHTFHVMNANKIEFEDESFDTVSISNSLHHLNDTDRVTVLSEMKRVLTPNGLLIISEISQSVDSLKENSHRHAHHWWSEVQRLQGIDHFETFTYEEISSFIEPLTLRTIHVSEIFKPVTEEETKESLASIFNTIDDLIADLKELGNQDELILRGQNLKKLYEKQSISFEKTYKFIGRK